MMFKEKIFFLATVFVLLTLTGVAAHAQQQTPPPTLPSATPSANEVNTGAISGLVVNERGEPMPGASVSVRAIGTVTGGRSTTTDAEGRFQVTGLDAGLYLVSGFSPAYVPQFQGPEVQPVYHRIGDSVRIEMIRGAVITGTVTGATGEPVVGIRVRAFRIRDAKGEVLRTTGATERSTDDRGIYRLYGLRPGTYVVSAGGRPGNQTHELNPYEGDVPIYALSSTRDAATEFTVRGGEETTADIRYRSDPGHAISGSVKVVGANGASVTLIGAEGGVLPAVGAFQAPGARGFEVLGVGDGDYYLVATEFPSTRGVVTTIPDVSISDPKRITVKGADVSGIELTTRPSSSISGRIALEPSKAPECQGKRRPLLTETLIEMQRHEKDIDANPAFVRIASGVAAPDPKGAFLFRNMRPGRFRLNPNFHARFWYLQSISLAAPPAATSGAAKTTTPPRMDLAATWGAIKAGEQITNVTIALAEGAASIRGRVPGAEDAAIPTGTAVYLVPAEAEKASDVLRYFVTNVSPDGTFSFNSLPPGRYWSLLQSQAPGEIATLVKLRLPESADARTKLRRTAESQKSNVELKPCQTLTDYQLSFK